MNLEQRRRFWEAAIMWRDSPNSQALAARVLENIVDDFLLTVEIENKRQENDKLWQAIMAL